MTDYFESTLIIPLERTLFLTDKLSKADSQNWAFPGWTASFTAPGLPQHWKIDILPVLAEYVLFNDPLNVFKVILYDEESARIALKYWGNRESIQKKLKAVLAEDVYLVTAEHPN
jgi:hypothetical protein